MCRLCSLAFLLELRIDSLLFLLDKLCLPELIKLSPIPADMVSLANFVNGKFFVCLHFNLASFLERLLLDERNLKDASRGDVMNIGKRNAGKNN